MNSPTGPFPAEPLGALLTTAQQTLSEWLHLALDQTVRLAVTGLNQSGKTVFITALVHQLLHARQDSGLPFFECVSSNRFAGSKTMLQPDVDVSAFRYDQFIHALTQQPPCWPTRTEELSEIRLAIRFQPSGLIHRQLLWLIALLPWWTMSLSKLDHQVSVSWRRVFLVFYQLSHAL